MNVRISDHPPEREILKNSIEKFIQKNYDFEARRALARSDLGFSSAHWKTFAELGWLSLPFSEAHGGLGGSMLDIVTVTETFGRALVLEPFVANLILGGRLIELLGSETQVDDLLTSLISGEMQLALAHTEQSARGSPACVACEAIADGDGYIISGEKLMVLNGSNADKLLVTARSRGSERDQDGIEVFLVDARQHGIRQRAFATVDGMRASNLTLSKVRVDSANRLGDPTRNFAAIEQVIDEAIIALSAEAIGVMDTLNTDTVEYAKTRRQFGGPIGKFQALQFRMVDMWLTQAQCVSSLHDAAASAATYGPETQRAVSALKVMVTEASRFIGEQAVQIHGAVATTDELRVGHYFKRLLCLEPLHGDMDYHLDRYANLMD